jgi:TENA/THI-4/PQQC family
MGCLSPRSRARAIRFGENRVVVTDLHTLAEGLSRELAPVESAIRSHPFLDQLESGALAEERLRAFACEQNRILRSDRQSFAHLAARYPEDPSRAFFLAMEVGEGEALARLERFAATLGLSAQDLRAYEPQPGCQAYPAFVAWLALNGSRLDVSLSFLVNLDAWGANCGRMQRALVDVYRLPEDALGFFDFFASPPSRLRDEITAVASAGIEAGDSAVAAGTAARHLQAYELAFWDALASGSWIV